MDSLEKSFEKIGARATVRHREPLRWEQPVMLDVLRDRQGREFFQIRLNPDMQAEVIDVSRPMRHLVIMVRDLDKAKYLCGHDERHWFCAAVPGSSVSTVETAIRSLRPYGARGAGVRRQGEWFFRRLHAGQIARLIGERPVIHVKEPISRGARSKPHICQEVVRYGGIPVWVNNRHPNGLTEAQYKRLIVENPEAARWVWQRMTRDARVFARGAVRHPDHATIHLADWHEVFLNTERQAKHAASIVFLD